jgi:hypothetical protein
MHRWRISRIRSTLAIEIGYVEAPDADQAVAEAIKQYGITDPHHQSRLVAQRVKRARRVMRVSPQGALAKRL